MILLTVALIKITLLILAIIGTVYLFRNKVIKTHLIYLSVLMMFFAISAQLISDFVPPLTDEITLTALGEKNSEAKGTEVYLQGITVDGEETNIPLPTVGKWFWYGNMERLCWRIETDSRQPEGVTRSVSLNIPVGWSRTLNFTGGTWRGKVKVETAGGSKITDTYAEKTTLISASIGRSSKANLILNQVRYLAAYAAIMVILWLMTVKIVHEWIKAPTNGRIWIEKHSGKLIYGSIALVTFCFMVYYADRVSFWQDEMAQVGFSNGTVSEAIEYCLTLKDLSTPLPMIFFTIWYHIAPYGQRWLLLVSIVPCVLAIYLIGLTGERIKDRYVGVLSAIFCATSTTVWTRMAYEFRPYPFVLLFASLSIYCYVMRNENSSKFQWHILYGLALMGLGMSHYFGMLVCAEFFLADLYLLAKRQISWKTGFDYAFPGFIYSVWVGTLLIFSGGGITEAAPWQNKPDFAGVNFVLHMLSGDTEIGYWIFLFGIGTGMILLYNLGKEVFEWRNFYQGFLSFMIVSVIALAVIYATSIRDLINMTSTLWVHRYFMVLIPSVCLLMGNAVDYFLETKEREKHFFKSAACFFLGAVLILNCLTTISQTESDEPYREAADYIYQQSNYIFNKDTIIISRDDVAQTEGWQEYYISRQGQRDPLNVYSGHYISEDELLQYNRVYVQYCRTNITQTLLNILDKHYNLESDNTTVKVRVYTKK